MVARHQRNRIQQKASEFCWRARRWRARRRLGSLNAILYVIFFVLLVGGFIVVVTPLLYRSLCLQVSDRAVLFAGLLTGAIVWWQGHLIRRQMELGTTVGLYSEWNSEEMLQTRGAAWLDNRPNPDKIEGVLEFLEKVSTFEKEGFISRGLIWDTFGWYLWRYHFYCKNVIEEKRREWTPAVPDPTLYQDLERLYPKLVRMELAERNCRQSSGNVLTEADIVRELEETKVKFIEGEIPERDQNPMTKAAPKVRIELGPSRIHKGGVGVFAVCDIENGQKICDGLSEDDFKDLVSWEQFERYDTDLQKKIMAFCVGTPDGFVPPIDFDFNKLSIEWYLNHSCEGNCGFNDEGDFVAIGDVREGEELSYDYGLVESNPRFSMECTCGSRTCRHVITGNDWKMRNFFLKNREHMHPHLRRQLAKFS